MKSWLVGSIVLVTIVVLLGLIGIQVNKTEYMMISSIPDWIEYPIVGLYFILCCLLIFFGCILATFVIYFIFYMLPICVGNIMLDYYHKFNLISKDKTNENT